MPDAALRFGERHGDMARIRPSAHLHHARCRERVARQDRDAVIALLAHIDDEGIAEGLQRFQRKHIVGAFGLLQTQDVGPVLAQEAADLLDAQANGIDVPGRDGEFHGRVVSCRGRRTATTVLRAREAPASLPSKGRECARTTGCCRRLGYSARSESETGSGRSACRDRPCSGSARSGTPAGRRFAIASGSSSRGRKRA